MKIIDGGILKSKMKNNSRLVLIVLILLVIGLTGCKDSGDGSLKAEDKNMALVNQSHSFKGVPEELYFGKVVQESFSDQGLDVKYLSSFNDGVATYLFLEIIDTGSNLFNEKSNGNDFSLNNYDFLEKTGYTDSKFYGLISFDKKRLAATICVEYIGTLDNENISFHIYSLNGNQKIINETIDEINLYDALIKTNGEFENDNQFMGVSTSVGVIGEVTGKSKRVEMPEFNEGFGNSIYRLKKDIMAIPIKDEEGNQVADITNVGWKNGWLHVQINPNNNIEWIRGGFNLKNNDTGDYLYSPFNMAFGIVDGQVEQSDYYEYVFYVGDMTKENLDYSISFRNVTYMATKLTGDWEIKFAITNSLVKNLDSNEAIPVKGEKLLVQSAVISPVNITLFASSKDVTEEQMDWFRRLNLADFDVKILYEDKKTIDVPKQSGIFANQKGLLLRFVYTPENFADIVGLEVNGVTFPVTGD